MQLNPYLTCNAIMGINPLFMTALGTAAACILLAVFSLLRWHQPDAAYLLLGSLLYLVGILVTIMFNTPLATRTFTRGRALARVEPDSTDSANLWVSKFCPLMRQRA